MSTANKIAGIFLWPGEKICDALGVKGDDHRLILRLWANLIIYGVLSLVIMLTLVD